MKLNNLLISNIFKLKKIKNLGKFNAIIKDRKAFR